MASCIIGVESSFHGINLVYLIYNLVIKCAPLALVFSLGIRLFYDSMVLMEEYYFCENMATQQLRGQLILQSKLIRQAQETITACVYSKGIHLDKDWIPFCFDLVFTVTPDTLEINSKDDRQLFSLPNKDSQKWRESLKHFLNQKGFHNQYKALKKIGKGNFASVFLVQHINSKEQYAVKAFSKEAAYSQENGKECLMKEIDIMRRLNSSNIMKLYEVFESDNSIYIIFELIKGGQLYERIKNTKKLKPRQVQQVIGSILRGLQQMHSHGIMHRDLKPENILMREEGSWECVIADFGLSEFMEADKYLFVRCGTPGYVAPQVINIKDMSTKYTTKCDIFSLGLIFHLLLFSKSVFPGTNYQEVLKKNRASKLDFTTSIYQTIEAETLDLLKKMLEVDPNQRITAQMALNHPYFQLYQNEDQSLNEISANSMKQKGLSDKSFNRFNKQSNRLKKDSCLQLKQGKENTFTGKTETVGSLGSSKFSGLGESMLRGLRISKFSKQPIE